MRAYDAAAEEAARARDLLKDWAGEGLLTEAQYRLMEQETVCELRRTNIFLRLVLFLFTLIIVGAGGALFYVVFLPRPGSQGTGVFLLIGAAVTYVGAELAAARARLYRYGIEEALAACSIGLLCLGMQLTLFEGGVFPRTSGMEVLVPVAGVIASLWIWYRFGLWYALPAAMIFAVWLPSHWTASGEAHHSIVAVLYAAALCAVIAVRRRHRFTYLNYDYSIAEALLWLGIYLAINLQLSHVDFLGRWWRGSRTLIELSPPFYWATWVLIWCLPPVIIVRGLRQKDRFVIAIGGLAAVLTLATNKPYLGWQRHTWDPMLLGVLLIAVALLVRRWLARGPGEIRSGFTARRLSGKDKAWLNAGITAFGFATPSVVPPSAHASDPTVQFGGGDSGGGGASSDF